MSEIVSQIPDEFKLSLDVKVLFYGNQGNTGYRISKWLRALGHDVDLYIPVRYIGENHMPEWEDHSAHQNWLHRVENNYFHFYTLPESVKNRVPDYDVVLTTGRFAYSIPNVPPPVTFITVGFDITQLPFYGWDLPIRKLHNPKYFCRRLIHYIVKNIQVPLYRRRIQRFEKVTYCQWNCLRAARKLGVASNAIRFFIPVDIDEMYEKIPKELSIKIRKKYENYHRIFFIPSRKHMDESRVDYKGSEKFLEGLKKFIDKGASPDSIKVIATLHGRDRFEFVSRAKYLNLVDYFDFYGKLKRYELHALMKLNNCIVFDSFNGYSNGNLYSMGGCSREALSFGAPLVTAKEVDSSNFEQLYGPNCPAFRAFTRSEICNQMEKLTSMKDQELKSISSESKNWAYENLHWENRKTDLERLLE